jgi:hypothetical protein
MNALCERLIGTLRRELLDRTCGAASRWTAWLASSRRRRRVACAHAIAQDAYPVAMHEEKERKLVSLARLRPTGHISTTLADLARRSSLFIDEVESDGRTGPRGGEPISGAPLLSETTLLNRLSAPPGSAVEVRTHRHGGTRFAAVSLSNCRSSVPQDVTLCGHD